MKGKKFCTGPVLLNTDTDMKVLTEWRCGSEVLPAAKNTL